MRIEFYVDAPRPETGPIGQPRQRHDKKGRSYLPADHAIHGWKQAIRVKALQNRPKTPIDGVPISLDLIFSFPWPEPSSKSATARYIKTLPSEHDSPPHLDKPDFDNLAKAVCDVLTDAGVIADDKLISTCTTMKRCSKKEPPGVMVIIKCELPDEEEEPRYHMGTNK
jgi:Holliday junction resolvase RusA-like endonuclease